jgi:hypothetical protein
MLVTEINYLYFNNYLLYLQNTILKYLGGCF